MQIRYTPTKQILKQLEKQMGKMTASEKKQAEILILRKVRRKAE